MTKVSVIIRSMDRPTLKEALQSLDAQTHQNIEIILVNAKGGTHRSFEQYTGRHEVHYADDDGFGLRRSAAANVGLDVATGEMIIFLDDDDYLLPEHLSNLVDILNANPTLVAAYSAVHCVDEENQPLPQTFGRYYCKARLMSGNFMPIHSVLFRNNERTSGYRFDPSLEFYEDWDFWLQLADIGDFKYHPDSTAVYRLMRGSGFGVNGWGSDDAQSALHKIVKKWHRRWTQEDIFQMMEACRMGFDKAETLHHLEISHKRLTAEADNYLVKATALSADIDQKSAIICTLEHQIEALEAHLNTSNNTIEKLLSSTSWKITKPARTIIGKLRK